ncbi:MAG: efflux transporter outer membrane subunit [Woeseiaceae bacterium]|nr:efflux transporter outer membrane subunit [Woeseiaceae bacterium]
MAIKLHIRNVLALLLTLTLSACAGSQRIEPAVATAPSDGWARATGDEDSVSLNWIAELSDDTVTTLVREALASNFELKQQQLLLENARQAVVVAGADRWPSLSASLGASRRGTETELAGSQVVGTDYDLDASILWELDIWGGLSASARAARLDYEADLASFEAARRELVAGTVSLTYEAIAARQLLSLFEQRLASLGSTLDIVNGNYRRGLTDALDVYLAQNALEQQREVVAQQRQTSLEATADLQLLLGRYPGGDMPLPETTPFVQTAIPVGLPSELVIRRQDIVAAWLSLMAADARIAVAHRNRFPRLVLTASGGRTSSSLSDIVDADATSWSAASSLTQPILQAGRLKAAQTQAEARAAALEQQYLAQVHRAFADVENSISRSESLNQRYAALLKAESNARAAEQLSLEQYQRGLVSFTTVLEAQRRAFDTGTSLVRVRNQLVQNRVTMYLSLGGEFILND